MCKAHNFSGAITHCGLMVSWMGIPTLHLARRVIRRQWSSDLELALIHGGKFQGDGFALTFVHLDTLAGCLMLF